MGTTTSPYTERRVFRLWDFHHRTIMQLGFKALATSPFFDELLAVGRDLGKDNFERLAEAWVMNNE